MKKTTLLCFGVVLLLCAGCSSTNRSTAASGEADFVLTNGRVYTVNPSQPWAEAVAVRGNQIVYVGDNTGARGFVGSETEAIDLKGRLLLPGFVESHIHIGMGAGTTSGVILESTDSLEEVLAKVSAYAAEHPDKKTIFGASYSAFIFGENGPQKELNVDAQSTGNWAVYIQANVDVLGQERHDTVQFPFRSWADDGVTVALGSDWPATPGGFEHGQNPFNNMYTAMHRKAPPGLEEVLGQTPGKTLKPVDQVLTLEEAIAAYTIGGAKMLGIENEVGTIQVGKKADLILLSQNLFEINPEEIPKTKVLGTMFDGRIVHDVLYDLGDSELVDLEEVGHGAAGPCSR